ncbi:hypothetical protein Rvan_3157 [Rhodomicrobium vannielii ATCC 17100]|uniref:Uncharacterized protein n=1 Tax=Rhodomicrobium vannielii (strain ATCC 17100 / DSM 162 / LMG 4299 / NCIMB 10020 / ATH 3.1.1) TaxID=648757 RepID=E3I133_RHOVT|nr:hypothetical protein Rvan_3157 [Rhodomicrobium vannielii ATCC 17100]
MIGETAINDAIEVLRRNRSHGRLRTPRKLAVFIQQSTLDRSVSFLEGNVICELQKRSRLNES